MTRENIDALNAKFADFQHPPSMYLNEYQELTSKLHYLEIAERELVERAEPDVDPDPDPDPDPDDSPELPYSSYYAEMEGLPFERRFLRAHLPNKQRTGVHVKPGVTLREGLQKALKLRNLTCDMCEVVRSSDHHQISWDVELTGLDAEEV